MNSIMKIGLNIIGSSEPFKKLKIDELNQKINSDD
jgi:hypothetical protein